MTLINTIDNVEIRNGYYKSGALCLETPYVNGERHGIEKEYYESGALMWVIPYVNGKIHGIERGYEIDTSNIACLTLYNRDREVATVKSNIYGD